jgi:hypothetical protein
MALAKIRTALSSRLTERREYRRLSAELAAFQTPAERSELDQMLGRYSAEETHQIRQILDRQDSDRLRAASVIGSPLHRAA